MIQWAHLTFLLKDIVQTLKIVAIISVPIALVLGVAFLVVFRSLNNRGS